MSDNYWIGFLILAFMVIVIVWWATKPRSGDPPD